MTTRSEIVADAREWIGTPWIHQHRSKGIGVDCAGLIVCVAKTLKMVAPDFDINGYSRRPDGSMMSVCDQHMRRIQKDKMQPGDVLVVAVEHDPQHMGIVGNYRHGGLSLIHANSKAGRVVETRLMFANNLVFRGAYALPGVD